MSAAAHVTAIIEEYESLNSKYIAPAFLWVLIILSCVSCERAPKADIVNTDIAPIIKHFPKLPEVEKVEWIQQQEKESWFSSPSPRATLWRGVIKISPSSMNAITRQFSDWRDVEVVVPLQSSIIVAGQGKRAAQTSYDFRNSIMPDQYGGNIYVMSGENVIIFDLGKD